MTKLDELSLVINTAIELRCAGSKSIMITPTQITYLVVEELIEKRKHNLKNEKLRSAFDTILHFYLDEEEYQKYVIKEKKIKKSIL